MFPTYSSDRQKWNFQGVSAQLTIILMESDTMSVADGIRLGNSTPKGEDYDARITLSYVVFSMIFLAAIYFASTSSGLAPGELALMLAFP